MRISLVGLLLIAFASTVHANGRDPGTSTITFRPGMEQQVIAGMTFGLVTSSDGGATWQWYCELTVGYGGTYDPDYAYSATGALFATTFDGLRVMRDGCTFAATPPGTTFVSRVERGSDGAVYFAASDQNDTKVYKSTDDGVTFTMSASPGMPNDWWQSIAVARADPSRVYLTGYRLPMRCTSNASNPGAPCAMNADCPGGMCEPQKEFLLLKSLDGGASYMPMQMTGITQTSVNSAIDIAGTDPTNADVLYAHVSLENATSGNGIYKSTDAGTTWTKILSRNSNFGSLSFLVRNDGSCVAGTRDLGGWKSQNCDANWVDLEGEPHIMCLYENSANEVWACTQNTASPQLGITSDGYGIMKSTDLSTWTGVLRFEDIEKPVSCGAGTVQEDRCVQEYMDMRSPWCCLVAQLGIDSAAVDCTGALACFATPPEPPTDAGVTVKKPNGGCCDAGARPPALLTALTLLTLLWRPRRRRAGSRNACRGSA